MAFRFFNFIHNEHDSGIFRKIPLSAKGSLFASPMPYGAYDPRNRLIKIYKEKKINHIYSLVTDEELQKKARRDIFKKYAHAGMTWSRHIIPDFQAPTLDVLHALVTDAQQRLRHQRVIVHCHAGVGRTAVAISCMVMAIEGLSPDEAIDHVKQHMTINITTEQKSIIKKYADFRSSI
jgi:protein-tyrosine phosphatase